MAKGISKRAHHKKDREEIKRRALAIGGVLAAVSLLMIIISVMK